MLFETPDGARCHIASRREWREKRGWSYRPLQSSNRSENRSLPLYLRLVRPTQSGDSRRPEFGSPSEHSVTAAAYECDGHPLVNPFVNELRQAYRNSRIGNPNNRGLESDFSRRTYVPTKLDKVLLPRIVRGDYRLVLLSGNPGDGKTSFLSVSKTRFWNAAGGCHRERRISAGK